MGRGQDSCPPPLDEAKKQVEAGEEEVNSDTQQGRNGLSNSPLSLAELKVQQASSDPTTEPASSSTPRNLRADVSELPASGGQALQVSALSSLEPSGIPSEDQ
ncbi:UNVERIFIED_CONTAM: hypothetical protein FKN15_060393 [Acipenser sinensis]